MNAPHDGARGDKRKSYEEKVVVQEGHCLNCVASGLCARPFVDCPPNSGA